MHRTYNACIRDWVLPYLSRTHPDLLLILKGHSIDEDNRRELTSLGTQVVTWAIDSISRFPAQNSVRQLATRAFFMDGGDLSEPGDRWLPLGYEEDLYNGLSVRKDIDVLFIGYLRRPEYARRRRLLFDLRGSSIPREFRCVFVGTTGSKLGDARIARGTTMECRGRVLANEYARLIASARVCVNVHQDDGINPVNPAFFCIPAAGTCQIAEDRPYLTQWLTPFRDYIPFSEDSLVQTVLNALETPALLAEVAESGRRTARDGHGFVSRARTILADVGLSSCQDR
ncbi:MAG: glycosyltransferase family 1 protein [Armatimonadetes bacterium]|nr:glycosyltransferase family 1 protein [Armatimonadota bacterium]